MLRPADLPTPLPLLKAQVRALLDQAQIKTARNRAALPSAPIVAVLPDLLSKSIACLALDCD